MAESSGINMITLILTIRRDISEEINVLGGTFVLTGNTEGKRCLYITAKVEVPPMAITELIKNTDIVNIKVPTVEELIQLDQ